MPQSEESVQKVGTNSVTRVVRRIAPWYGGIVAVYTPIHAIYGRLQGAGMLKISLEDLMFNICNIVGLSTFVAAFFGVITASMGFIFGDIIEAVIGWRKSRVIWVCAILGAIGFGAWMIIMLASDPRDFTNAPKYGGFEWFMAVLGATVLVMTYVFFGKRLVDQLKNLKGELEKNA